MMDAPALVIIAVAFALIFAFIGSRVQRGTKFVYPKDPFTIGLVIFMSIDVIFWLLFTYGSKWDLVIIPLEPYACHIPIVAGYMIGYWLWGMQEVKQIKEYDMECNKDSYYEVFYFTKDKVLCLAEQTNRGMFKRVFFKIHHEVIIPGHLSFWNRESKQKLKRPWWPLFKYDEIEVLDRKELNPVLVQKWIFHFKKHSTRLILADKYHIKPSEFIKKTSLLHQANITITELSVENENLKTMMDRQTFEKASILNTDMKHYGALPQYFEEKERKERDKALEEARREREMMADPKTTPEQKWSWSTRKHKEEFNGTK